MKIVMHEHDFGGGSFLSAPHVDCFEQGNCVAWIYGRSRHDARLRVREALEKIIAKAHATIAKNTEYMEELERIGYWEE